MSKPRVQKERTGLVLSNKCSKTITVVVERLVKHSIYKKFIRQSTKFMVHDERSQAKEGDKVRIVETRPLSRHKRWRLQEILEQAK